MAIEIEKKYVVTPERTERIVSRLAEVGARFVGERFEENIIFQGGVLTRTGAILRIRKVDQSTTLTYKVAILESSDTKHQIEHETLVGDADELDSIIVRLGFAKTLVYEKKRRIWRIGQVEVVLDELPFGLYIEIEGDAHSISECEILLEVTDLAIERATYPYLTQHFGKLTAGVTESRFER